MPQRKCAVKELKKNHARHMHNMDLKTDLKKTIKRYVAAVKDNKTEEAKTNLSLVYKKLDKAAKVDLIKANAASRKKSRLSRLLLTPTAEAQKAS
ncbi:MAG: 30S ribosomal protein S20 [Candidatus Omnitrophica bacterium]|nr:30S ribosomal protein S20 [Candidatus Omnitrophota bacterium]